MVGKQDSREGLQGIERWQKWAAWVLIGVAVVMRVVWLNQVPGVNGDEAWYGVQAQRWLAGGDVEWLTPTTKNLMNPFYFGLVVVFERLVPATVVALRAPAVVSGLALVALVWILSQRLWNRQWALAMTLMVATNPVNIIYSRFGWDSAQTGLATWLVLFLALAKKWPVAVVALAAAIVVHPTNLFLLPMVILMWFSEKGVLKRKLQTGKEDVVAGGLLVALMAGVYWWFDRTGATGLGTLTKVMGRWLLTDTWIKMASMGGWFFTGLNSLEYVAGSLPWAEPPGLGIGVWVVGGYVIYRALKVSRDWQGLGAMALGYGLAWLGFAGITDGRFYTTGLERFFMWALVPILVLMVVSLQKLEKLVGAKKLMGVLLITGGVWVGLTWQYYFVPIRESRGEAHATFVGADPEPKVQAYKYIAGETGSRETTVMVDEWWLYEPLVYLGGYADNIDFKILVYNQEGYEGLQKVLGEGGYVVGFAGGTADELISQIPRDQLEVETVEDFSGKELIKVWRVR